MVLRKNLSQIIIQLNENENENANALEAGFMENALIQSFFVTYLFGLSEENP